MQRLMDHFSAHPWWVLTVLFLVSLAAATQLQKVEVQISADELLVAADPERVYFEQIRERFGDDEVILLIVEDDDVLAPDRLEVLGDVVDQLEALPFVDRVESLFSVPRLRSVDGYLKTDPYLNVVPESEQAASELLHEALESPFVRNVLLAPDGRLMAVAVVLDEEMEDDEYALTSAIDEATRALDGIYANHFAVGFPYVRIEVADKLAAEQGDLFPLAIGALLIALFILLRHFVDILTPVLTSGLSILWTLGLMGAAGIPMNVVTSIVPILLIIVGSTEDIHLIAEFRRGQLRGFSTAEAVSYMAARMGRTVLLTFVTTFAGFLSIGLSRIEVLTQFAVLSATGLLLNFLITISLIPALMRLTGRLRLQPANAERADSGAVWAERYWHWLHRHRRKVLAALTLVTLISASGIPAIHLNHSAIDNLASDSRMRAHIEEVNERLAGMETLSIILESGIEGTFLKVRYLDELEQIQSYIRGRELAGSTTSFADYLALMNGVFQELGHSEMPANDDEVYELMIFLDHEHVKSYVSEDYSTARILVRHDVSSSEDLERIVSDLNRFIDIELDPGLRARVTGDSMLKLSATRAMVTGQLQSVLVLLLFVVLIISVLFADLKVGLLAALPNAFPVVLLFGFMGYGAIPLNVGTAMAAAIAIGLAVDDTMHFMLRYNQELKSSKSQSRAMQLTIQGESLPIVSTSVALMAGFMVFSLSDFAPVSQFGVLSAVVIGAALVADFVITPLAISALRLVTLWDLLAAPVRQQIIPKSPLFRGMRPWQIRRFILSSTVLDYGPGEYVFRRHDESTDLFLVMRGVVEVSVPEERTDDRIVVGQFGAGEIFGDVALLAKEPRKTDAITLVPTCVLVLNREAINNVTLFHPFLGSRLFLNLATDISRRWVRLIERTREAQKEKRDESRKESAEPESDLVVPPGDAE